MEKILAAIKNRVPENSLSILEGWFRDYTFLLVVSKTRHTKLGDYRAKRMYLPHRISVNHNLNQYAFLITLTHEFAHLLVFEKYKNKVAPHGLEWKNQFAELLLILLESKVFPTDLEEILFQHVKNPAASSVRDMKLTQQLKKYDTDDVSVIHLLELEEGALFSLKNNRIFVKGQKRRTRFLCQEKSTKKQYLIHGAAEVVVIN